MRPPEFVTVRWCPECGGARVLGARSNDYAICAGPHMGPFPTDRSHKPTVTVEAIYNLSFYEIEAGESPDRKRRERNAARRP
jgi:hypothetical protein